MKVTHRVIAHLQRASQSRSDNFGCSSACRPPLNREITRNAFEFMTPTLFPHSENKWIGEDDASIRHGYK